MGGGGKERNALCSFLKHTFMRGRTRPTWIERDVFKALLLKKAFMDGPIAMLRHTVGSKVLRIGRSSLMDGVLFIGS